jgi:hypothetical protein
MLMDGLRPALLGLGFGLAAGAAVVQLIRSVLYETQPLDPAVFIVVSFTRLLVPGIACLLPAWRLSARSYAGASDRVASNADDSLR